MYKNDPVGSGGRSMFDKEIEKVGDAVLDLIDSAVDSRNYSKLNEAVSQTLQSFIDSGSDAVKKMMENRTDEDYKKYRYKVPQSFRDNTKSETEDQGTGTARAVRRRDRRTGQGYPADRSQDWPYRSAARSG